MAPGSESYLAFFFRFIAGRNILYRIPFRWSADQPFDGRHEGLYDFCHKPAINAPKNVTS
jgi:hypothetical protein